MGSARMRKLACNCDACALHRNSLPTVPLHPWEFPDRPWQRLHLDFAGPFKNFMWLIVVDTHSNWPEVLNFKLDQAEKSK